MSYEHRGHMPLDYDPVVYPGSVLRFRGPAARLDQPYILCLGGTETFGRFIHAPFCAQLDAALPCGVVNMGVMNAGLDVMLGDGAISAAIGGAAAVVLQITGAQNLSNRLYCVHPRRNDRFTRTTAMLRMIYRDVDFTEFHFTRHMLSRLQGLSADRFAIVEAELQTAWLARMRSLLNTIPVPVHLVWLSRRHPDEAPPPGVLGADPLFVTPAMLAEVAGMAASLTIASPDQPDSAPSTRGMFFAAQEAAAARALPGPDLHERAAQLLLEKLA